MPLPSNKHSLLLLSLIIGFRFCSANSGSSSSSSPAIHHHHDHDHDHEHHSCSSHHYHHISHGESKSKLPEELAEEEDLKLYGFGSHHEHDHLHNHGSTSELSLLSLWIYAMGCSFLVSMASLICLIILPLLFLQGKPSKTIVDSLAAFGAGAMLGDAFLHQLPHAFGGIHSHSHDEHLEHNHEHSHHLQSHSHSLEDLSVGLSILSGVILFLLVEKIVRYVEENSGKGAIAMGHGHHHHGHPKRNKLKDADDNITSESLAKMDVDASDLSSEGEMLNEVSGLHVTEQNQTKTEPLLRQRRSTKGANDDNKQDIDTTYESKTDVHENGPEMLSSNLVFGYLNLFSDGVHNFTDGMALGSAFLLHGFVGGWSRTLFLLVHEIPQEVGDFGILVRSGFSVSKALFFNFLSALVALAGTALALLLGELGQSSLIEGFTAGGFIYIAVAGVLPEMNIGKSSFKNYASQLTCLILGMGVALCISLVE